MEHKRWIVTLTYNTNHGVTHADFYVEELGEISNLIESGPHWDALSHAVVTLNPRRRIVDMLTVETAEAL